MHLRIVFCAVFLIALIKSICEAAEPVRLTDDGKLKSDPTFVNEGRQLVFTWLEQDDRLRLMRMSMKTKKFEPLHKDVTKSEFEAAFSPDGRYYAFVQSRGNLNLALVIRNTKENKQSEVPPGGGFSGLRSPTISPDAKRVLFCYPEQGRQHIYSVNVLAKDKKQLTDSSGVNNWPSISRDGKQIVFGSTRDGNYEIYVMKYDGSDVRRITESPRQDMRPEFSPDGSRIAFTSSRDGNYEIYVVNSDGSQLRRLTTNQERDDYATWHPDGKHLAVVSERAGRHDLYLYEVP